MTTVSGAASAAPALPYAHVYRALGLAVIPLIRGTKRPPMAWAERSAEPPSYDELNRLWRQHPGSEVGCILGDRFSAFDVDEREDVRGLDELHELEATFGPLPETWRAITPSGGLHVYFRLDGEVAPTTHPLAPGVQLRAGRHIMVLPPSGGRTWEIDPSEADLASLPAWVPQLVREVEPEGGAYLPLAGRLREGVRHPSYVAAARSMARAGFGAEAIVAALDVTDRQRGEPPKGDREELEQIAAWAVTTQAKDDAP
jgi:hypothetical protein